MVLVNKSIGTRQAFLLFFCLCRYNQLYSSMAM